MKIGAYHEILREMQMKSAQSRVDVNDTAEQLPQTGDPSIGAQWRNRSTRKKAPTWRLNWQSPPFAATQPAVMKKEGSLGQQRHHGLAGDVGLRQQARHSTGKATTIEGLAQA